MAFTAQGVVVQETCPQAFEGDPDEEEQVYRLGFVEARHPAAILKRRHFRNVHHQIMGEPVGVFHVSRYALRVMVPHLPDVRNLLRISKAIAMLDAILSPEWQYRYYSFNSKWATGTQMASMRNGEGDDYFILFNRYGAILKGYAHESIAARSVVVHDKPLPGMFDGVPEEFGGFLTEPAFSINETTFCFWRRNEDVAGGSGTIRYPAGSDPGGASELLAILEGDPECYVRWARHYYRRRRPRNSESGMPVDASAVRQVYQHEPLTERLVQALNPQVTLHQLAGDIEEIGYP
jgi:hypothetical protein